MIALSIRGVIEPGSGSSSARSTVHSRGLGSSAFLMTCLSVWSAFLCSSVPASPICEMTKAFGFSKSGMRLILPAGA